MTATCCKQISITAGLKDVCICMATSVSIYPMNIYLQYVKSASSKYLKASDFSAPTTLALCLKTHQTLQTTKISWPFTSYSPNEFPQRFFPCQNCPMANPGALGSMTFSSIGIHGRFPSKWPLTPKEAHLSNSWLFQISFFLTKSLHKNITFIAFGEMLHLSFYERVW